MSLIVITLTNAPVSLRGDLTKWLQEISIGVYVGNVNTRVREQLWERVTQTVGKGQATLTYTTNNELGYDFKTFNCLTQNISYDGVPLVFQPLTTKNNEISNQQYGFSKASKFRKARRFSTSKNKNELNVGYVVLDIETNGLDIQTCDLVEVGAIKFNGGSIESYESLIEDVSISREITELTGIDNLLIKNSGRRLESVLEELSEFIGEFPLVGYNINFDIGVLNRLFHKHLGRNLKNRKFDLLRYVKKEKLFLKSYNLESVLKAYEIFEEVEHRALSDAKLTFELSGKVNLFQETLIKKAHE